MFPLPLTLVIAPSQWLRRGLLGLHGIAMAAIWLTDWPTHLQALPSLVIVASAAWQMRSMPLVLLRCHENGQLSIKNDGAWTPTALGRQQTLMSGIVLLQYRLQGNGATRRNTILADSLPAGDFRRLQVWLRWVARPENTPSGPDTRP